MRSRPTTPISNSNSGSDLRVSTNTNVDDAVDDQMQLFLRHSSPMEGGRQSPSMVIRNSSPSLMGLSRPRSNPRNRTPMRFESPLGNSQHAIPEESVTTQEASNEGRRITIFPMAGSARGTNVAASLRNRQTETAKQKLPAVATKSRKQGPSHRKIRRWNNDNFINLAAEVGSDKAAQALLNGHSNASKYHSVIDNDKSQKSIMTRLAQGQNEELQYVRDKFYNGELYPSSAPKSTLKKPSPTIEMLTAQQRMHRIERRLRRVVVKAIENSYPATKVMQTLEQFLMSAFTACEGEETYDDPDWKDILVEPPTITRLAPNNKLIIRFLFDKDSQTGGFNRLLLHALVQFHSLVATSATTSKGRMLTATGSSIDKQFQLVDCIMKEQQTPSSTSSSTVGLGETTSRIAALKV